MVEEKKEAKEKEQYQVVKIPTEYGLSIQTPDGEILTSELAIVEILNKLDKIEKAVA